MARTRPPTSRLHAVYAATGESWQPEGLPVDEHLARDGRVVEALAGHCVRSLGATSYRRFLAELGSCEADGEEFLDIYRTPAKGDILLGTVSGTLEARQDPRFPPCLLVIQYDGWGGLVCLDVTQRDDHAEAPVVVWDPGIRARRTAEARSGWPTTSAHTPYGNAHAPCPEL